MSYPNSANGAQHNSNTTVSGYQVGVASATNHDLLVDSLAYFGTKRCTCTIVLSADGTLSYMNYWGDTITQALTKGPHAIEAQQILNGTTVAVVCFF